MALTLSILWFSIVSSTNLVENADESSSFIHFHCTSISIPKMIETYFITILVRCYFPPHLIGGEDHWLNSGTNTFFTTAMPAMPAVPVPPPSSSAVLVPETLWEKGGKNTGHHLQKLWSIPTRITVTGNSPILDGVLLKTAYTIYIYIHTYLSVLTSLGSSQ